MFHKKPAMILFGGYSVAKYPAIAEMIQMYDCSILAIDEFNQELNDFYSKENGNSNHPFQLISDFYHADNTDTDKIFAKIDSWSKTYQIKGIYSIKEIFVKPAGYVADYLNLAFPGLRAIELCRNKYYQRIFLQRWSPNYQLINPSKRENINLDSLQFPLVIKPISRHSSSGVKLINNKRQLQAAIHKYPADEEILLEENIIGNEYSVETLIQNGKLIFANVTNKRTNANHTEYFVEMAHTIPDFSLSLKEKNKLLQVNAEIINELDFDTGVAHAEYKINDSGEIYLIEIAARNPGDALMSLYYLATDELIENQLIRLALNLQISAPKIKHYARQVYLPHTDGILSDVKITADSSIQPTWFAETFNSSPNIDRSSLDYLPGLKKIMILKKRGSQLTELKNSHDRCVTYLISAESPEKLDAIEKNVTKNIHIYTE